MILHEVDFDPLALEAAAAGLPTSLQDRVEYFQSDLRKLPLDWSSIFDVVVDKGTLDALVFGDGITDDGAHVYLAEIERVLSASRSAFFQLTDVDPDERLDMLIRAFPDYSVRWRELDDLEGCDGYYMYTAFKA